MAICNRDLDFSQQVYEARFKEGAVATGATVLAHLVSTPAALQKIALTGVGVSGAPTYNLSILRWTASGVTSIIPGSAVTLPASYGVSGANVSATFNSGSTLSQVQAGDLLLLTAAGANTNVLQLIGSIVLQATQDIKTTFGV